MFDVMSRQCDQCLLSPNRIVRPGRVKGILKDTARKDCHFICHKGSIAKRDIACRAHYDATGGGQLARIARRLRMVREIDPETLEPVAPAPQPS
jgi:hypothetical protein